MGELLAKYTATEIIVFIVLLAIAVKEVVTFIDWAHNRLRGAFKKEDEHEEIKQQLDDVYKYLEHLDTHFTTMIEENRVQSNKMQETIDILLASDKDDIKAWITQQHHYFCYELGYIDDFSLDCIEKRYSHYQDEGGNSFIAALMAEIRALPKKGSQLVYQKEGANTNAKN